MVRALVLLAVGGAEPPPPGAAHASSPSGHALSPPCRLLYARSFATPETPGTTSPVPRQRLRRKEQLAVVARQVASQYHLLQSASGYPTCPLPDNPISMQDAPGGFFQLPPGDPFPEKVTVTWLSVLAIAFALVCDPQENLTLAEMTLRRLASRLVGSFRGSGTDILLRVDVIDGIVERFLPHGQMLFLNQQFLQATDRQLGIKIPR